MVALPLVASSKYPGSYVFLFLLDCSYLLYIRIILQVRLPTAPVPTLSFKETRVIVFQRLIMHLRRNDFSVLGVLAHFIRRYQLAAVNTPAVDTTCSNLSIDQVSLHPTASRCTLGVKFSFFLDTLFGNHRRGLLEYVRRGCQRHV